MKEAMLSVNTALGATPCRDRPKERCPQAEMNHVLLEREEEASSYSQWHALLDDIEIYLDPEDRRYSYTEGFKLLKIKANVLQHLYILDNKDRRQRWLAELHTMGNELFCKRSYYPQKVLKPDPTWRRTLYDVQNVVDHLSELEQFEQLRNILGRLSSSAPVIALDLRDDSANKRLKANLLMASPLLKWLS